MIQIGVDFGGTKIEAAALNSQGAFVARMRAPNPGDYDGSIRVVCDLVRRIESDAGERGTGSAWSAGC